MPLNLIEQMIAVHGRELNVHILKDDVFIVSYLHCSLFCCGHSYVPHPWKGVYTFSTAPRAAAWITQKGKLTTFLIVATRDGFMWKLCPEKDFESKTVEQKYVFSWKSPTRDVWNPRVLTHQFKTSDPLFDDVPMSTEITDDKTPQVTSATTILVDPSWCVLF